jgi:hypothetical protein
MSRYLINKSFIFISFLIFLCACGTHGKIISYTYNVSKPELQTIINSYIKKHPELTKADNNPKYNLKGSGYEKYMFNCYIANNNDVYTIQYLGDSIEWAKTNASEIGMIYAAKFGEDSKSNAELGFFEKRAAIKIFEADFINKLPIKPVETDELYKFRTDTSIHSRVIGMHDFRSKQKTIPSY